MQRARQGNLKVNPDKCKIRCTEVLYIGHVLIGDGLKPGASKLKAILEMPAPEHKHGVQLLLGMVNYVAKFAPFVSEVTAPLRELLKKDMAWHWTERHEQSFHNIKSLLTETSPRLLKYCDPKMPVKLQVDACKSGLGAVFGARWVTNWICFPFTYYAQIEK